MWRRPSMTKTCTCMFWRDDGLCSCPCTRKRQHALHQWKHRAFTDREWQYQRSAENKPCGAHGFNAKYLVEPGDIRPEKSLFTVRRPTRMPIWLMVLVQLITWTQRMSPMPVVQPILAGCHRGIILMSAYWTMWRFMTVLCRLNLVASMAG